MYVRNGYDGHSETVNVLASHIELPRKYVGTESSETYNFQRVGCTERGSCADFCYEAVTV